MIWGDDWIIEAIGANSLLVEINPLDFIAAHPLLRPVCTLLLTLYESECHWKTHDKVALNYNASQ